MTKSKNEKNNILDDEKKSIELPSIFSVQRCFIISDALMFNHFEDETRTPVIVVRHGILGTQNVTKDTDVKNPQRTESAKTHPDAIGLEVEFSLATILLKDAVFASNSSEFRQCVNEFISRFSNSEELSEICRRYARNILNGRWLWRNRILAQSLEIQVRSSEATDDPISIKIELSNLHSNAHERNPVQSPFGGYTEDEKALGDYLKNGFTKKPIQLNVHAIIKFGFKGAIEVFPSQNYVSNKPQGFARSLYKLNRIDRGTLNQITKDTNPMTYFADMIDMGQAALRDQKVGNAIRTIDTWYEKDKESSPIPVEPKGANIETNSFKRERNNLFELLQKINTLSPTPSPSTDTQKKPNEDAMFVLANIIRGFLAGEKEENTRKK